ncbi:MAG: ABC transporter permease [Solirubrobacterales bacterium]
MLLKNVVKVMAKKWMQLIAIGIIIIFSSCTFTMMAYALGGIEEPTSKYLDKYNQEDFSVEMLNAVTVEESKFPIVEKLLVLGFYSLSDIKKIETETFNKIINSRISKLQKVYPNYSFELREFKKFEYNFKGKNHKALIIKDSEKINLSYIEEGVKPLRNNEIAINRIYAEKNAIQVGDFVTINKKQYKVTGFVLFPDYTLPMFDDSFNLDTSLQSLILMTDIEYEKIDGKEWFRFSGTSKDLSNINTAYDKEKLPFVTEIILTKNNLRSGAIYYELTQGRVMAIGLSIFIASIAVVIVSILIYNLLNAERGQIGILKALGYRKIEIAKPYFLTVMFIALLMLLVGYIVGLFYSESLKNLYLDFYLMPSVKIKQNITVFSEAIFIPMFFFALVSGIIIYKTLGETALELIRPKDNSTVNKLSRYISRLMEKAKGATKFKYLHSIRNTKSFFIFFIGIMFYTMLISFSFMSEGMVDRMTVDYLNKVDYKYESYADFTKTIPETGREQEKFLLYPYAYLNDNVVTLEGLRPKGNLYKLIDESGKDITLRIQNGAVITKRLSIKLGVNEGDSIKIKINNDYYEFVVKGITDEYISDKVYLKIEKLSNMLSENKSSRLFSGIYSTTKPSAEYYNIIVSKSEIIEQSKAMDNYTSFMINIMVWAAAVIAASIVFVLTSFTVEKNYYVISLLKVMGYSRKEVNSMILNSYFAYTVISYLISVPAALGVLKLVMKVFAAEYNVVLPLEFKPFDVARGLIILIVIFYASTWANRRKIEKISLQEVLKAYGE